MCELSLPEPAPGLARNSLGEQTGRGKPAYPPPPLLSPTPAQPWWSRTGVLLVPRIMGTLAAARQGVGNKRGGDKERLGQRGNSSFLWNLKRSMAAAAAAMCLEREVLLHQCIPSGSAPAWRKVRKCLPC